MDEKGERKKKKKADLSVVKKPQPQRRRTLSAVSVFTH